MTNRLSRRQRRYRAAREIAPAAGCHHDRRTWYTPLDEARLIRTCGDCGAHLEAPVRRCTAWLGSRGCLTPAVLGDRCRMHR